MKFCRLTLRFMGEDRHLEQPFLEDYFNRSIRLLRFFLLAGCLFYAAFGILDAVAIPAVKLQCWTIRYLVVCPMILALWALSFTRAFKNYWQAVVSLAVFIAGVGIIAMAAIAPPPGNADYYAGLILVFLFCYMSFRTRFLWATGVCWLLIIVYEVAAVQWMRLSLPELVSNNFFLVGVNIVGMCVSYCLEYLAREAFFLRHLVETEKTRVIKANRRLESKVRELEAATEKIRVLTGFIPICARCKKIRDDKGFWNQLEEYITRHSDAEFSHSLCPECAKALYPELWPDPTTELEA
ncbi:MAG: hypothetical protein GXP31_19455 [Kiritimatiellaeota bacterium]|nr:hypothetical protein [Kiritimatiellota bacterium]